MKLEDQVVSLELAKKLKELGFEQESYFMWVKAKHDGDFFPTAVGTIAYYHAKALGFDHMYPAYTVAELGEMLPRIVDHHHLAIEVGFGEQRYTLGYPGLRAAAAGDFKEADARAKMLIYLKEEK